MMLLVFAMWKHLARHYSQCAHCTGGSSGGLGSGESPLLSRERAAGECSYPRHIAHCISHTSYHTLHITHCISHTAYHITHHITHVVTPRCDGLCVQQAPGGRARCEEEGAPGPALTVHQQQWTSGDSKCAAEIMKHLFVLQCSTWTLSSCWAMKDESIVTYCVRAATPQTRSRPATAPRPRDPAVWRVTSTRSLTTSRPSRRCGGTRPSGRGSWRGWGTRARARTARGVLCPWPGISRYISKYLNIIT